MDVKLTKEGHMKIRKMIDDCSVAVHEWNALSMVGGENPHVPLPSKMKPRAYCEYEIRSVPNGLTDIGELPVHTLKRFFTQLLLCVGGFHESLDLVVNDVSHTTILARPVDYEFVVYYFDDAFYAVETCGFVPIFVDISSCVYPSGTVRACPIYSAGFLPHAGHPMDDVKRILVLFSIFLREEVHEFAYAIEDVTGFDIYDQSDAAFCRQLNSWDLHTLTALFERMTHLIVELSVSSSRTIDDVLTVIYAYSVCDHVYDHMISFPSDAQYHCCFSYTSFVDPLLVVAGGNENLAAELNECFSLVSTDDLRSALSSSTTDDDDSDSEELPRILSEVEETGVEMFITLDMISAYMRKHLAHMTKLKNHVFGPPDRRIARAFVDKYMRAYFAPTINPELNSCVVVDMRRRRVPPALP